MVEDAEFWYPSAGLISTDHQSNRTYGSCGSQEGVSHV